MNRGRGHAYHPAAPTVKPRRPSAPSHLAAPEPPLIEPPETLAVDTEVVSCDGGVGALGHPLVYLNIGPEGFVDCPYCDRRFQLRQGSGRSAAH